ncbi:Fc.00g112720.m01.CDS01 [Cosmosporella sp. VM-42]
MAPELPSAALVATTAVATVAFLAIAKATLWPARPKVLRNPLKLGVVGKELVYQPDAFPGARDVDTPYGTIRVYEFGPENGEKVLFVHGISTPCITLGPIAHALVKRGCRVMLFDLFGRGFSDNPSDLPQDARLYTTQILLVLASSPLAWTGTNALRLVGYSLGGGIAIHVANAFPHLVSSLVLLAPAGLIRPESFGRVSQFLFKSGLVPERLLAIATRRRLQQPIARARVPKTPLEKEAYIEIEMAAAEALDPASGEVATPLERRVLEYVRWSVENHEGFVPAFMSSIRHAPLTGQHDSWRGLTKRAAGTTAIFLARNDEIIEVDDYTKDGLPLVGGEDHVRWRVLPGGHDFVMTHTDEVLQQLDELWGMKL